jgi:non-canonical (house-cleaning) NTP pyrophosphatase/adenine/guanine phosphoribosyltransferase-like PRPP-binding protein
MLGRVNLEEKDVRIIPDRNRQDIIFNRAALPLVYQKSMRGAIMFTSVQRAASEAVYENSSASAVNSLEPLKPNRVAMPFGFQNHNTFFKPLLSMPENKKELRLGNAKATVPLCKMPDNTGYFFYFKLNDHPELVQEGARLIAERIQSLGVKHPYFVTPEASTLALAHVLRYQYKIDGITLYKTKQINDVHSFGVEYATVTATDKKRLYLGSNKVADLKHKSIFILDSVCTTGGTVRATYDLLIKAGVSANNIVEAILLFNEGFDPSVLSVGSDAQLKMHRFAHLPLILSAPTIKIVVASEGAIKIDAVKQAAKEFFLDQNSVFEVIGVNTVSDVAEQPFNEETEKGATNRLAHAERLIPSADMYIAIENGIFESGKQFFDKAVIKMKTKTGCAITESSQSVEFPAQYVEEAKTIGFDKTTVGSCMLKAGIIKDAKDPHADLGDKRSRSIILDEAIQVIFKRWQQESNLATSPKMESRLAR